MNKKKLIKNKYKPIFKKKDYNSEMGMSTHIWGPSIHHALHTISFNYPINPTQQQKEDYYNFVYYLGKVLPCGVCRNNLPRNLKAANWDWDKLKNRETFSKFIYNLHQKINLSTLNVKISDEIWSIRIKICYF